MMSRHFRLRSEHSGAIAKSLTNPKNQLSVPGSFFNQVVNDIYIYVYRRILTIETRLMYIYVYTSALRLLALRGWRTLCVRRRLPSVTWR